MANKRKPIGKKVRFEVFKRDKFACQYCGGKAPDVVLVCDHVHPVARGGDNGILNLVTSCETCNSGKGAIPLDDATALAKQRAELDRLAERREQVEMLLSWQRELSKSADYEHKALCGRWSELIPEFYLNQVGMDEARKRLRTFSLADLLAAMEVSVSQYIIRDAQGKPTAESADKAWAMIPGIARLSKLPPDERQLYYIRGIVRKRLRCPDESFALKLLRNAMAAGVDLEDLRDAAKRARNWSVWCNIMEELIGPDREDADGSN